MTWLDNLRYKSWLPVEGYHIQFQDSGSRFVVVSPFFLSVLCIELTASHVLHKHSTTELHPQAKKLCNEGFSGIALELVSIRLKDLQIECYFIFLPKVWDWVKEKYYNLLEKTCLLHG